MPAPKWKYDCLCDSADGGHPECPRCGEHGAFAGWLMTMHEAMSAFSRATGLPPRGPRRTSAEGRAIEARLVGCGLCDRKGLLHDPHRPELWAWCPRCKGNRSALDGDFDRPVLGAYEDPMNGIIDLSSTGEEP